MKSFVILLRGVNVGGRNKLPMKQLRSVLERAGFEGVQTYIQSGNIVLNCKSQPDAIVKDLIEREFGLSIELIVLSATELARAVCRNPFMEHDVKTVHFYFCRQVPSPDDTRLGKLVAASEQYKINDKVFYLHAPDGIGRSRLAGSIDACLGVPATGRNLNTVQKLAAMVRSSM